MQKGWTALHVACQQGHDKIVKILLQAGADYGIQTSVSNFELCILYASQYAIFIIENGL